MSHKQRFTLFLAGEVLGYSDLEDLDDGMGVAGGTFVPTDHYATVQPVFRRFAAALEPKDAATLDAYYRERDALPLRLATSTGMDVATSFIHIEDFTAELPDDPDALRLVVQVRDAGVFRKAVAQR